MKNFRKLIALILVCSLIMSTTVSATGFSAVNSAELVEERVLYSSENKDTGSIYKVTSVLNDDGTYTIRGYKGENLVEEYIVMPGSNSYVKREFCDKIVESKIVLSEEKMQANKNSNNTTRAGYLGTMYYNNVHMGLTYMIYCTVNSSVEDNGYWVVGGREATVAGWIVELISSLGIAEEIASNLLESLIIMGIFVLVVEIIRSSTTMQLKARVVTHTITGTSTSPLDSSYHEASLFGQTATITAPGSNYAGETFTKDYTPADWGTNAFGRAMFKAVYNSDWTPTGWTD